MIFLKLWLPPLQKNKQILWLLKTIINYTNYYFEEEEEEEFVGRNLRSSLQEKTIIDMNDVGDFLILISNNLYFFWI